ncbi:MAG: hypothetical protein JF604_10190 [Bradyrhizobium sp.]|nr:hypothetical protein [Bradyrhizobium sp.]
MKVKGEPAVAVVGAETPNWVAVAAATRMFPLVPVIELLAVSVAVIV